MVKLFDDGQTVVEAVRLEAWWRPRGMDVQVDEGQPVADAHYVRIYRNVAGSNEWPQFFVLYMDGNMRLIPHPPEGRNRVCFGSSVIVGPVEVGARPLAEIDRVTYFSATRTMVVTYRTGDTAVPDLGDVSRAAARVTVAVYYPTDERPFAAFRSMFVAEGNADVDHVQWRDAGGAWHDDAIFDYPGGQATEWLFHRATRSRHNTSAPDIRVSLLE